MRLLRFAPLWMVLAVAVALVAAGQSGRLVRADAAGGDAYLTGQLLVATPDMGDPRFAETVIYMVSHDADGAMGLVVNRVLGTGPLGLLLETLEIDIEADPDLGEVRLLFGGPVEPERGFVLHSDDFEGESTRIVANGIAVSFGTDALAAMAQGAGPRRSLVLLGYAGWGPGQLESELARADWLVVPAEKALVFSDDPASVWERARESYGIEL